MNYLIEQEVRPKERIHKISYSCVTFKFMTVAAQYDYCNDFWNIACLYYIV